MNKQQVISTQLSLYLNGTYCETATPYQKNGVVMLPLQAVAKGMGYFVDHDSDMGVAVMYARYIYERKTLTVRYVKKGSKITKFYYYHSGDFIDEIAGEFADGEIYIPVGVFSHIGWDVSVSEQGNINIRLPEKAE
jgi:hypothetical protein